ncbi:hypothetical protein [Mycobacterium sp. IDR2000157661]|uniref:hypothetical protein n=1 Tax=Mycobacterium sp. IDR2000157661 TaxID=2867005 RepID=UPI001EEB0323|nr:hypothetical protein [Mycobacterium sp. IDR2000157661]ULE34062.1 hypothetical protein K3G64_05165 [Mycobacterium sp. IDR2000157661]
MKRLTDAEAMAQVVDAARDIVRVAGLADVTGAFTFESCNDQGEPPYRGRLDMSFGLPEEVAPEAVCAQIAAAMVAHGWSDGPPPGSCPFGVVVHTDSVMAVIGRACGGEARGSVQVCGQCGTMTDHRRDGATVGTDVTSMLGG